MYFFFLLEFVCLFFKFYPLPIFMKRSEKSTWMLRQGEEIAQRFIFVYSVITFIFYISVKIIVGKVISYIYSTV